MKALSNFITVALLLGIFGACEAQQSTTDQSSIPSPTPYSIVTNGANSRIWQRTVYEQGPSGQVIAQTNSYTELATGLNYQDPSTGQWVPSQEIINILPNGTAAATKGQHQVYFPGDIYQGEIELVTPDGIQLQSRPVGLSYDDGTNTVFIAILTNSVGQLLSSNQVIYPNAFAGLNADLLYTYTKVGFEQDVILREQPPSPAANSLNPATTRLQVVTEFFDSPPPVVIATPMPSQGGISLNDESLDFGVMKMMPGRAFLIGANANDAGVWVGKSWVQISGRQFLVEEVPLMALADQLSSLPGAQTSGRINAFPSIASHKFQLPPQRLAKASPFIHHTQLSQNTVLSRGLVFDYQALSGNITNYVFQGDTTYYISGNVILSGTNTFEGGTVIKYARGYGITLSSSAAANWDNGAYRPVIFTAVDDNTVGDSISGSSGSPSGYYANPALDFAGTNISTVSDIRVAFAQTGIETAAGNSVPWFYDDQFVNCQYAAQFNGSTIYLRNILFAGVQTNFVNLGAANVDLQNATFNNITSLATVLSGTPNLYLTNCIFANVTNYGPVLTNAGYNGFYNSSAFGYDSQTSTSYPFQTVGAGNYYLTNGCYFLSAGTAAIDPVLLADLTNRTTYPPAFAYTNVTVSGTWSPQVQRDTNATPTLGYHYTPIDYAVSGVRVGLLILTNGVAVASFQGYPGGYLEPGFIVGTGEWLISVGTASAHNQICHYAAVQEQPILWGGNAFEHAILINASSTTSRAVLEAQFSDFSGLAGLGTGAGYAGVESEGVQIGGGDPMELYLSDCRVGPGWLTCDICASLSANECFNNLFDRGGILISDFDGDSPVSMVNNLVHNGYVIFDNENLIYNWTVQNNFFDNTALNSWNGGLYENHNGFWNTTQLIPTNANDVVVTNFIYATGPLGSYYQVSTNLLNKGSTTAAALGLFHYTVQTNLVGGYETAEGTNTVSIGYHYVATDQYGNPLDSNGDGIPDYLEDPLGNGLPYGGANWALAILSQPVSQTNGVGSSPALSVTADGIAPITYQWYFESNLLAGATNAMLTLNDVQTNSAGSYFVVVTNNVPVTGYYGAITSSVATLTVVPLPTVTITNPANNTVFAASSTNVTIQATASDAIGTISQVQFFEGTTNLGIVTSTPYQLTWSNATAGNYALTAVATDDGVTGTSPVVNITITPVFETNTMTLWLKADAIIGLTNNAPISSWPDSSGLSNNMTSPSSINEPSFVTNAVNGYPVIYCKMPNYVDVGPPGTPIYQNHPEYMNTSSGFMNAANGVEAFVVLKVAEDPPENSAGCWSDSNLYNNSDEAYPNTDGSIQDDFGANEIYSMGVPAQPLTNYNIYEVTSQSNVWSAWINGVLLYQTNGNSFGLEYELFLPNNASGTTGTNYFGGDIAEALIFNRGLAASERATVNAYLNGKYGLVSTIPSAPSNLVATAISATQVGLTWSEPLAGGATQISIERSTTSGSGFLPVAQVADALSYVDTNLAAGTTYYYQARAINVNTWSPYSNQTNATTLISGTDIPFTNLVLWLKADSGLAQIGTNTPTSSWVDQSGNGNGLIQSSGNINTRQSGPNRPFWVSGTNGGFPVVNFAIATNNQAECLFTYNSTNASFGLNGVTAATTGMEAFAVLRVTADPATTNCGLWYYGSGNDNYEYYPTTNGFIADNFGSSTTYSFNPTNPPTITLTNYHVYEVTSEATNWSAWINGALQYYTNSNPVSFSSAFDLGAVCAMQGNTGTSGNPLAGNVAEVMIFNQGLSAAQRDTIVTNYLFQKYNIPH